MLFYLALRNIISRKSSLVIVSFIALTVMLFSFVNAVFDSTENGVQETFCSSFTGDLIIRPESDVPLSLFGDETPVTGMLTKIKNIIPFNEVYETVKNNPYINKTVPQVSCTAALENGKIRIPACLFGVKCSEYLYVMDSIEITEGTVFDSVDGGCLLQKDTAEKLKVSPGSTIQAVVADGISFRIRSLTVTGIYEYTHVHSSLEKIVLADFNVVRELSGQNSSGMQNYEFSQDIESILSSDLDDEDFFFSDEMDASELFVEETENSFSDNPVWNFIVCRTEKTSDAKKAASVLNSQFKKSGWPAEAVLWRQAAGSSALYIYWLRVIFNGGIFVILIAGFIVINNTLVIHIFDRTKEIGTLRAIGASSLFVSAECFLENLILSMTAAVFGILFSFILCSAVSYGKLTFSNSFLIQLFGSEPLILKVTPVNAASVVVLCFVLAVFAWIIPVKSALSVEPVKAIQGAK